MVAGGTEWVQAPCFARQGGAGPRGNEVDNILEGVKR